MPDVSTRDRLIEKGLEYMQENSYSVAGINEVLAIAGVSKGSFYHYFSSKEEFGNEVLKRYLEQETQRASVLLSPSKMSPVKRLRKYFEELIGIYGPKGALRGGCLLGNLSQEMADHSDVMQRTMEEGFRIWEATVAATLQEAVSRGELPAKAKTVEMASFILNSYEGALIRAKAERSEAPLRLFLKVIFHDFLFLD